MWFYGDDPVSTHTLACASYEIIHAVSKARDPKRPDLLFDSAKIRDNSRKEFNDFFREAANFFKHGDRDPHGLITFAPGLTQIFIYFAIRGLHLCGESPLDEFIVFERWLQISNPSLLPDEAKKELGKRVRIEHLAQLRLLPKHEFFDVSMRTMRLSQTET